MAAHDAAHSKNKVFWIVFAILTVFFYYFGMTFPLVGPDEPRYAQVAREMFERGDWITPTLGGFNWFEKPALLYWLQIISYGIFGVSEFAARFGSALFGLGTIFSLWILGKFSAAENDGNSSAYDFANRLALIAASSLGIIVFSRGASFDIILTFPMTAALVSFYVFDLTQRRGDAETESSETSVARDISASLHLRIAAPLVAFYFFIGVSLLAKGLIGIVFPFAIVAFYYLLSWRLPSRLFILSLFWGTLVSIAVASLWYLPMYQRHGLKFIDEFFIQHHFQRFTSNKYFHPQPFYFFFWVLPLMTIPWLPFFAAAIWDIGRKLFNRRDTETRREVGNENAISINLRSDHAGSNVSRSAVFPVSPSPLLLFALAWLTVPLIFFSLSGSKLPGYILPALPPAIVLTAEYVGRWASRGGLRECGVKAMAIATYTIVVAILLFAAPQFAESDSVKALIDAANERGYSAKRIAGLHSISHNAEFYAAGRLLRTSDGKQKRLLGPEEVEHSMKSENGKSILVLTPLEYLRQLTDSSTFNAEVIKNNGELAIVYVSAK